MRGRRTGIQRNEQKITVDLFEQMDQYCSKLKSLTKVSDIEDVKQQAWK